ncbi:MAG: diguanylate cyclase [Gammaproteobacteria bacterium]|nr:diguanylate cyclase [Gammaproteobacteria bacterium]
MSHDDHAIDAPAAEHDAGLALALQAALVIAAAAACGGLLPFPLLIAWAASAVVFALLRRRFGTSLLVWLGGGLVWGLGAATMLEAAAGTAAQGAGLLAVALAIGLAAAEDTARARLVCAFALPALAPAALATAAAFDAPAFATAAMLGIAGLAAWRTAARQAALFGAFAHTQAAHRVEVLARERLDEEVQRLRLETRAAGETRDTLTGELSEATQELAVLRSKAGALSNVLQRINPYDTETGLLTAEKFRNVMDREWARMRRQELPLSLLLVSIDRFDDFRTSQGRLGFEAALRRISDVLRHAGNRPGDVAARLAPGTFALLFPETEHKHVNRLADSVRTRVRQLGLAVSGQALTATVGMATVIPNNDLTPETLRERVEAALYEAQFQGGDRSVRYRTLDSIRVEHWDAEQEGQLTADGVRHKLAVLGYDATPKTYRPGELAPSRRVPVDSVEAVVEGQLRIILEGEARVLQPGDLLFIPKGLVTSIEVVGQRPVLCLEAIRA